MPQSETARAAKRRYEQRHKEELRLKDRLRSRQRQQWKTPEHQAYMKQWWTNHKAKKSEYDSKYYQENKERLLEGSKEYRKEWWLANRVKAKGYRMKRAPKTHLEYRSYREAIFHILDCHVCVRCGEWDKRCLQLDHINGGGNVKGKLGRTYMMIRYYSVHPDECRKVLQVLCANCNWRKRSENDENYRFGKCPEVMS